MSEPLAGRAATVGRLLRRRVADVQDPGRAVVDLGDGANPDAARQHIADVLNLPGAAFRTPVRAVWAVVVRVWGRGGLAAGGAGSVGPSVAPMGRQRGHYCLAQRLLRRRYPL
jgi:hypothetical protein